MFSVNDLHRILIETTTDQITKFKWVTSVRLLKNVVLHFSAKLRGWWLINKIFSMI